MPRSNKLIPVLTKAARGSAAYKRTRYALYDEFTTARAAGSVNGTLAEPWGGARTVTDANNKISISGGSLLFATGAVSNNGIGWNIQTRMPGKTLLGTIAINTAAVTFGWDATLGGLVQESVAFSGSSVLNVTDGTTAKAVGVWAANNYQIAMSMRSAGTFFFIKGGLFTNWTLLYTTSTVTSNNYPVVTFANTAGVASIDNVRIPKSLYVPAPLQSDGMSAATTDGLGNAENNGPTGNAYTNIGTWGAAGGVRSCSALSGGIGISYLATTSADVIIDAVCTRTSGNTGIVTRYADASNYLIAYHDGTNAKLDRVVAGVTTNLISAAATYSASAVLRLVLEGTTARLFYNNTAVGSAATVPSSSSANHGLFTTHTGATFDNLVIWARGTGNEYATLDLL